MVFKCCAENSKEEGKKKNKKPCGIYDGPVIYTEVLDNLDKNVTASLHVLQIHGVKPLEQLMESSHIISC